MNPAGNGRDEYQSDQREHQPPHRHGVVRQAVDAPQAGRLRKRGEGDQRQEGHQRDVGEREQPTR